MSRKIKGGFLLFMLRWVSCWILKSEKNKILKRQGNSDQDVRINLTEDWRHTRGENTHITSVKKGQEG